VKCEKIKKSVIDEASDFKFGLQLRFANAHHKTPPRRKSGRGPGLGEVLKILWSPYNISATAIASDFKYGVQPRPIIKSHPEEKVGIALG